MSANDGGPAFPRPPVLMVGDGPWPKPCHGQTGMSLRDWFAGQVLCGLVMALNTNIDRAKAEMEIAKKAGISLADSLAITSYGLADAMLSHREKGTQ